MDNLQHIGDQPVVETVGFIGRMGSKEDEGEAKKTKSANEDLAYNKVMTTVVLVCTGYNSHRFPSKERKNQQQKICKSTGPVQKRFKEKTDAFC